MFYYLFTLNGKWEEWDDFRVVSREWAHVCMVLYGKNRVRVLAK